MNKYPKIFTPLKEWFRLQGAQCALLESNGAPMLRAVLPLFEDGTGLVIMEIFTFDYGNGTQLLNFYTTMTTSDEGPGIDKVRQVTDRWTLTAFAGGYGVYDQLGELFHRHTLAIATDLPQSVQDKMVMEALYVTVDEITRRLPEAIELLNPPAE